MLIKCAKGGGEEEVGGGREVQSSSILPTYGEDAQPTDAHPHPEI